MNIFSFVVEGINVAKSYEINKTNYSKGFFNLYVNTIYMSTLIHTNVLLPEFAVFDNQDLATKMLQES